MNSLTLLLFLVVAVAAVKQLATRELLDELELELELEEKLEALSRARRSAQCGKKIMRFVLSNCPEGCTTNNNANIATKCCAEACSDDFIKTACCP